MTIEQNKSPADYKAAEMDSASAELVGKINAMLYAALPIEGDVMAETRKAARAVFKAFAGPDFYPEVRTKDLTFPGPESEIPLRAYFNSEDKSQKVPLIVFYHGGGWALNGLDDYDGLLKSLSAQSGANIMSVAYRLAPEHPFPDALNDAQAALDYVIDNAADFGGDPNCVAVMGDSAGGNLAAVLAQSAENKNKLAAQFLLYPMLDVFNAHTVYPSRLAYGDGAHFLTRAAIDKSVEDYTGGDHDLDTPRISPLFTTSTDLLPPTYIMVGECDPLRDESRAYIDKLKASGVPAEMDCIPGAIHAFLSFGIMENVRGYRSQLAQQIQRRLNAS